MRIKDLPDSSKPRERFLKYGPKSLSDAELFAIVLRTGSPKENAIEMSNKLISEYSLDKLSNCSLKELLEIKGIGSAKAMQILSIAELGKRFSNSKNPIKKVKSAKDVFLRFKEELRDEKQENFYILILNNANNIIKEELITKGILDSTVLHPREIFKPAITNSASKIILVHNHPSGDPSPSREDLETTKIFIEAGKFLGIEVIDHVIIGNGKWWSWKENKRLPV